MPLWFRKALTIDEVEARHRRQVFNLQSRASSRMRRVFRQVHREMRRRFAVLAKALAKDIEQGLTPSDSLLRQATLLAEALRSVESASRLVGVNLVADLTAAQQQALQVGILHLREQAAVLRSNAILSSPSQEAVKSIVGFLSNGSPLTELITTIRSDAVAAVEAVFVSGLAEGSSTRVIARALAAKLAASADAAAIAQIRRRAETIARNETLRAYTSARHAMMRANSDVVTGWAWISALDTRTCVICWGRHGQVFSLDDPMWKHVLCRCSQRPIIRGSIVPLPESGDAILRRKPRAFQRAVFHANRTRFEIWDKGVSLADMVVVRDQGRWGKSPQLKLLKDLSPNPAGRRLRLAKSQDRGPVRPVKSFEPDSVGIHIKFRPNGKHGVPIREALEDIDQIHSDGNLPDIRTVTAKLAPGTHGQFVRRQAAEDFPGMKTGITISSSCPLPRTTFVHELGHGIDWEVLSKGMSSAATDRGLIDGTGPMANWGEAVRKSKTIMKAMNEFLSLRDYVREKRALGIGVPENVDAYLEFLGYWLRPREIWARGYAQMIGRRSTNPAMQKEMAMLRAEDAKLPLTPDLLPDDEFDAIESEMIKALEAIGWKFQN